jgi:hypothetical protein
MEKSFMASSVCVCPVKVKICDTLQNKIKKKKTDRMKPNIFVKYTMLLLNFTAKFRLTFS